MDYTIREIQKQEYPLLDNFLYEAIFIPTGIEPPPKTIITAPELQVYVAHFGELKDDRGLVTEVDGKIVGAVWVRIMHDYGHIDDETPSLAISLYKEYRGFGIGTAMMKAILALLKSHGYKRVSLSVQKANYAAKLYLKVGFEIIRENVADNIGFFKFIIVDRTKRGNGYGKEMLNLALRYAFQITGAEAVQLNVFSENVLAKQCYEKVGFVERTIDKDVFSYQDELWSRCNMIIFKQSS